MTAADEDEEMQRTILASLEGTESDEALARTLALSEQDSVRSGREVLDEVARDEAWPVGLLNSGNSCYFNAIVQTVFHIPPVRRAVLRSAESGVNTGNAEAMGRLAPEVQVSVRLVEATRRLFANMMAANAAGLDAEEALQVLHMLHGGGVAGRQEDVTELAECFLDGLERGLAAMGFSGAVSDLFRSELVALPSRGEDPGSEVRESASRVVVNINEETHSVDAALDEALRRQGPNGTERLMAFARPPQVLVVDEARMSFDAATGQARKVLTPCRVKSVLHLDRFVLESSAAAARSRISRLRAHMHQLRAAEEALRKTRSGGDLSIALDDISAFLGGDLARSMFADESRHSHDMARLISTLGQVKDTVDSELLDLAARQQKLRSDIADLESRFGPGQWEYSLFAAWMHAGEASSGHNWAYVRSAARDPVSADGWRMFDDLSVKAVDAETVLADATGGLQKRTAYTLIYVHTPILRDWCGAMERQIIPLNARGVCEDDLFPVVLANVDRLLGAGREPSAGVPSDVVGIVRFARAFRAVQPPKLPDSPLKTIAAAVRTYPAYCVLSGDVFTWRVEELRRRYYAEHRATLQEAGMLALRGLDALLRPDFGALVERAVAPDAVMSIAAHRQAYSAFREAAAAGVRAVVRGQAYYDDIAAFESILRDVGHALTPVSATGAPLLRALVRPTFENLSSRLFEALTLLPTGATLPHAIGRVIRRWLELHPVAQSLDEAESRQLCLAHLEAVGISQTDISILLSEPNDGRFLPFPSSLSEDWDLLADRISNMV